MAGRLRDEPENRQGCEGLAAPRFSDDAECLAGIEIERDVVHRPRGAFALLGDEVGLQIANAQQYGRRAGRRHAASSRGSSASRTPSATALSDITTNDIARPGKRVDHGAV